METISLSGCLCISLCAFVCVFVWIRKNEHLGGWQIGTSACCHFVSLKSYSLAHRHVTTVCVCVCVLCVCVRVHVCVCVCVCVCGVVCSSCVFVRVCV